MVDIELIKELRDATGLSLKEIGEALKEAEGDKMRAVELLKTRGIAVAQKKASRITQEGVVNSYIHATKKIGAMIELLCETDFVARNPLFSELSRELAMQIAAMDPGSPEELLEQPYMKDETISIRDLVAQHIAKLGENIKIGRFIRFQI